MYEYEATVVKVVDGDTVHLDVDLGLETSRRLKCRLKGINAPELKTEAGKEARGFLTETLKSAKVFRVETVKDRTEKYGRYLVLIYIGEGEVTANDLMIDAGHAEPYMIDT